MKYAFLHTIRWSSWSIVFSAKTVNWTSFTLRFYQLCGDFLQVILSLIAIKNSQRKSREGQGACVHQSSFCPGARGWLSPALWGTQVQSYLVELLLKVLKQLWRKCHLNISKWLDFRVFSHKDVKIVGTSDPYQLDNSLLGNPLTNERETR
jgi:hypothetical protein